MDKIFLEIGCDKDEKLIKLFEKLDQHDMPYKINERYKDIDKSLIMKIKKNFSIKFKKIKELDENLKFALFFFFCCHDNRCYYSIFCNT